MKRLECIDAGSDHCPCYLAEVNECITCSQLQGKNFCDCNWRGVCIYQEFIWAGCKSKKIRSTFTCPIISKININDTSYILELKTNHTLTRELSEPGSYVFVKSNDSPQFFYAPMSVLDYDDEKDEIKLAIQTLGSKTKLLYGSENSVMVRGPYWNGILGLKYIKSTQNSKVLLVLRGIAQSTGILLVKKLIKGGNKITVIIDKGKIGQDIINDSILGLVDKIYYADLLSYSGQQLLQNLISDTDIKLIYSGGSDEQHLNILNYIDLYNPKALLSISNNANICCGEGICGSCETIIDGSPIKSCKVQIDVRKAIERRVFNG